MPHRVLRLNPLTLEAVAVWLVVACRRFLPVALMVPVKVPGRLR
jgi:hypothetical protein